MEARYAVSLKKTEEGFSVWVPGLPGCWSQGATEEEALDNIKDAIREYLSAARELASEGELREVELSLKHGRHRRGFAPAGGQGSRKGRVPNRSAGQAYRHDQRPADGHDSETRPHKRVHDGWYRVRCRSDA
jgi:predicted RNase H-like HicB family nuclease